MPELHLSERQATSAIERLSHSRLPSPIIEEPAFFPLEPGKRRSIVEFAKGAGLAAAVIVPLVGTLAAVGLYQNNSELQASIATNSRLAADENHRRDLELASVRGKLDALANTPPQATIPPPQVAAQAPPPPTVAYAGPYGLVVTIIQGTWR